MIAKIMIFYISDFILFYYKFSFIFENIQKN